VIDARRNLPGSLEEHRFAMGAEAGVVQTLLMCGRDDAIADFLASFQDRASEGAKGKAQRIDRCRRQCEDE
jgi:hypothetical protein